MDPRAHRDPRAPHRGRRRGAHRHRAARRAGARSRWPAVDPCVDRPADRRDRHARHGVSRRRAALLADQLGMPDAAAYDLSAGCTGFVYAIAQAHGDARRRAREAGARGRRRRALEDPRLDRPLDASCCSATAPAPS